MVLQKAYECGVPPAQALENACIIGGKVLFHSDLPKAQCYASGLLEDDEEFLEGTGNERVAVCRVKRKGQPKFHEVRYSVARAIQAKLWGKPGPWTNDPERQLQFRSRCYALRDKFADVLKGMRMVEEFDGVDFEPTHAGIAQAHAAALTRTVVEMPPPPPLAQTPLQERVLSAIENGRKTGAKDGGIKGKPPEPAPMVDADPMPSPSEISEEEFLRRTAES